MARYLSVLSRLPRPSPALLIGMLALAVATTGSAVAATGSVVNIADGTTATNVVKVDSAGRLSTAVGNVVATKPALATTGFLLATSLYNYDTISSGYQWPFAPTMATIAVDRVSIAAWIADAQPRLVQIYYFTVPAGTSACNFNSTIADFRELASYRVTSDTVVDDMPVPIVLKPKGTRPWCLATLSQSTANNSYYAYLDMGGWVVSGSAPTGTAAARSTSPRPLTREQLRTGRQPPSR